MYKHFFKIGENSYGETEFMMDERDYESPELVLGQNDKPVKIFGDPAPIKNVICKRKVIIPPGNYALLKHLLEKIQTLVNNEIGKIW